MIRSQTLGFLPTSPCISIGCAVFSAKSFSSNQKQCDNYWPGHEEGMLPLHAWLEMEATGKVTTKMHPQAILPNENVGTPAK